MFRWICGSLCTLKFQCHIFLVKKCSKGKYHHNKRPYDLEGNFKERNEGGGAGVTIEACYSSTELLCRNVSLKYIFIKATDIPCYIRNAMVVSHFVSEIIEQHDRRQKKKKENKNLYNIHI